MKAFSNKKNYLVILLSLISIVIFYSCKKTAVVEPLGGAGKNFVKIVGGGTPATIITKSVDFVNTPSTIFLNIQRLVAKPADLEKKMTIKILDDLAAVTLFNTTNPGGLVYAPMPDSWYTVGSTATKTGGAGGTYTMIMNPAEFAKDLQIIIPNATLLNPSTTYALGFTIISVDAEGVIADSKSCIMTIGAKNKYDGIYTVTGSFLDVTNATFTGSYPLEYQLVTTGPSSVDVKMLINGDIVPGYLFNAGGSGSYFGNWGLTMTFDPSTDLISDLHNYYGDPTKAATAVGSPSAGSGAPNYAASNTRRAVLDPSGVNGFSGSAVPKTVSIKYFMLQPSSAAGAAPRCKFDETWSYKKSR